MTQEEIIQTLLEYLNQTLKGGLGYIGHDPYKSDFFALFREAYLNNYFDVSAHPRLTGDWLNAHLAERWHTEDEDENKKKRELMSVLFSWWDEWRYAWDRHD